VDRLSKADSASDTDSNRSDISQLCEMGLHGFRRKCQDGCMPNKKESDNATRASIKKEMAKPRMPKSVRIAELNLDAERIPGQARATMIGTVDKIIFPLRRDQPEKVQIAVDRYRDLRIENTLTDRNGDDTKLKKGAHVQLIATAKPKK
jgi:hypothetical protein